jgi:hypothetical protein
MFEAFAWIEKVLSDHKSDNALKERSFSVGGIGRDQSNDINNHFCRSFVLNQVHPTLKQFVKQHREKQIENDREVSEVNSICHIFDLSLELQKDIIEKKNRSCCRMNA